MPMAFAFRKPQVGQGSGAGDLVSPAAASPRVVRTTAPIATRPAPKTHTGPRLFQDKAATPVSPSPSPAPGKTLLEIAQHLADIGSFGEAAASCEAHLTTHGPSPQALYLMGLIHGAMGNRARAEDYFRKALYLEPDHEETLMHLALLLETKGDVSGGRLLRQRARRHGSKAT
jgi:chemotaxis protein methyltransferase WspC